jgi:hypothetical protein
MPPELMHDATTALEPGGPPADAKGAPTPPITPESIGAAADPWAGLEPELRASLVEAKAWKTPADAARAYSAAQKLLGKPADELAHIPKAGMTPEMRREIARRLGAPEKGDAYNFGEMKDEEGGPQVLGWFRGAATEVGLDLQQAATLAEKFMAYAAEQNGATETQTNQARQTAAANLQAKYGPQFEPMREAGARALAVLGVTDPNNPANNEVELMLETALGPEKFFELFSSFGSRLGEHKLVEGQGGNVGVGALQAEHASLMKSEAMHNKDHPGHAAAAARALEILTKIHGDQPAYGPGSE